MKRIDWKSGAARGISTFAVTLVSLWLLFYLLRNTFGIEFFADTILMLIGAGWLAYYVWKKTEIGYY